jgi:enoyl-CoA hydratase/carnithine racemase
MSRLGFVAGQDSDDIRCEQDGPVGILILNRPEAMNAITSDLEDAMHRALDRAEADDTVRAIVLTGAGDRAFSAGYDLGETTESNSSAERLKYWWDVDKAIPDRHWHLLNLEKPIIAAVRGWCLAGAFWYSVACDVTIAGEDAVFGQPEIRETQNSAALLPFLIGWKNAALLSLTGDHIDAHKAERLGLVNEVVPSDEVVQRAVELAKRMAMVPADSLRLNKRIISFCLESMGLRSALSGASFLSAIVHSSADDSPELQEMFRVRQSQGMGASLKVRDDKFRPEPGGPRAKKS